MGQPTTRPKKTVADYLALPDDVRAELIAGELYVTPAPTPNHQRVVLRLARELSAHVEDARLGESFISPIDVHLPTGDVVQPDLVVVMTTQAGIVRDDAIYGAPHLLIEVVSPSRPERDRIVKMDRYARGGVGEYWIVDPEAHSVEVFALDGGRFAPRGWFTGADSVRSPSLREFELPLARLFA